MIFKNTAIFSIVLLLILHSSALVAEFEISRSHSGAIKIYPVQSDNKNRKNLSEESIFPVFSQIGSSVSLFTTSVLFATGYNEQKLVSDFGSQFHFDSYSSHDPRQGIYAAEILLLLGTLSASIFNYNLGFDNDILAIIPIMPVQVNTGGAGDFHGFNENQYRVQYGLYFYFSRDF